MALMHDYECVECWYPITWDDVFGWLHEDREDGLSFDHDAVAELPSMTDEPAQRDGGESRGD